MPIHVTIPRLGWNMEEGTFVEWLKADGDAVRPGEALFRLEGEKATEDVESLDAGTLHIPADGPQPGDRFAVGAVIAYLLRAGEAAPADVSVGERRGLPPPVPKMAGANPAARQERPSLAVTPRAQRLAKRLGIDPAMLQGSGRDGRVRERDVAGGSAQLLPLTPVRRTIAARMTESCQTTAPVTLTSLVDATNLVALRKRLQAAGDGRLVPSYTDLFVKLAAIALQKHPRLAARWTDAGLVLPRQFDIGFAVDTDAGLLVPVVRDVPSLGLPELAAQSRELIDRARAGALTIADLQGGCFTVTNLGGFGIDAFTPIINPPECAVLGVGRIARQPVMDGDRVVGREMVTLSLTFDHRVVDGAPAARFVQALARCIEDPSPWVGAAG